MFLILLTLVFLIEEGNVGISLKFLENPIFNLFHLRCSFRLEILYPSGLLLEEDGVLIIRVIHTHDATSILVHKDAFLLVSKHIVLLPLLEADLMFFGAVKFGLVSIDWVESHWLLPEVKLISNEISRFWLEFVRLNKLLRHIAYIIIIVFLINNIGRVLILFLFLIVFAIDQIVLVIIARLEVNIQVIINGAIFKFRRAEKAYTSILSIFPMSFVMLVSRS